MGAVNLESSLPVLCWSWERQSIPC